MIEYILSSLTNEWWYRENNEEGDIVAVDKIEYDKVKEDKELLIKFIKYYSTEGKDPFGFMIDAKKILKKVEE